MFPEFMKDKFPDDNKSATEYLLKWMQSKKMEILHNPEVFIQREPGFYIGGLKYKEDDTVVTDNHGLPHIIRAGCCE